MPDFTGNWFTSFGPMSLVRSGDEISGTYGPAEAPNTLSGSMRGQRLVFTYTEARERGSGWFEQVREGRFIGEYLAEGASRPRPWDGNRGFDSVWLTTIGTMRMLHRAGQITALLDTGMRFEGPLTGTRLTFRDMQPGPKGEGSIELSQDGLELRGTWRDEDATEPIEIVGHRALPQPRTVWLIVLEAHWQRSLAEREFAFGDMLDEIFARLPHVNVRHRYFHDEGSLLHWCGALQFLPEPTVLVITSHGEPEGLVVNGKIIDSRKVIGALADADSLRLLHFSSCLVAKDGGAGLANAHFPVSGYTNSVDWMASALTEFTYLDMILGKHLPPDMAAEQVYRVLGFAGAEVAPDCPYPAAGFQFIPRAAPGPLQSADAGTPVAFAPFGSPATGSSSGSFLDKLDDLRRRITGRR